MDDRAGTDGPESSTSSTDGDAETKRTLATRGTEAVATAKSKAEDLRARVEASRPHSAVVDIAFGSYEHDTQVAGGILAGAVAFRIFLFIVPFVFFFVFAFGLYAEVVNKPVAEATDEAGIVGLLATTITNVGDQSFWSRVTLLVISGFALVSGARGLLKSLNAVHIIVWRLPRTRLQHQPRLIGGLILALLMTIVIAQLIDALREVSFPGWVLGTAGFILIPAAIWLFASLKVVPPPSRGRLARPAAWGAAGRRRHRIAPRVHGGVDHPLVRAEVGDLRGHRGLSGAPALGLHPRADLRRRSRAQRGHVAARISSAAPSSRAPATSTR